VKYGFSIEKKKEFIGIEQGEMFNIRREKEREIVFLQSVY